MVVGSHLHFHKWDGELVAFQMVPVNPLAGGREKAQGKEIPQHETGVGEEGNRLDHCREELATARA